MEEVTLVGLLQFMETVLEGHAMFAQRWVGRRVRLRERLDLPLPDGQQVRLEAGTEGRVVGLIISAEAPFMVVFPDVPYRIALLLEQFVIEPE